MNLRFSAFLFLQILFLHAFSQKNSKPNVILIVADDLGYMDLSCFASSFYETPNIDSLAARGIKFVNGYASAPSCTPTRASIITGRYPVRTAMTTVWGIDSLRHHSNNNRFDPIQPNPNLPLNERTLAEVLKEYGYTNFFAGKWHLGQERKYWPHLRGFDVNIGGWSEGVPRSYFSPYRNPRLPNGPTDEYLPERLTNEVINFIDTIPDDRPFFLNINYHLVHSPFQALPELIKKYRSKKTRMRLDSGFVEFATNLEWMGFGELPKWRYEERVIQSDPTYAAMIESLDNNIGNLMVSLSDADRKNTLIILTSDNGGFNRVTSNLPLRGGKGNLYEGGIKVPYIIWHPDIVNPGFVNSTPISSIDLFPTILDYLDLEHEIPVPSDGVSIVPFFEKNGLEDRALFWHYPHYGNGNDPSSAIRKNGYKLIENFETGKKELYDLSRNQSEVNDLSNVRPELMKELEKELTDWRSKINLEPLVQNFDWNGGDILRTEVVPRYDFRLSVSGGGKVDLFVDSTSILHQDKVKAGDTVYSSRIESDFGYELSRVSSLYTEVNWDDCSDSVSFIMPLSHVFLNIEFRKKEIKESTINVSTLCDYFIFKEDTLLKSGIYEIKVRSQKSPDSLIYLNLDLIVSQTKECAGYLITQDQTFLVSENTSSETLVGQINFEISNLGRATFSIAGDDSTFPFTLGNLNGVVGLKDGKNLDFESKNIFETDISITAGNVIDTVSISIIIENVNEAPLVRDTTFYVQNVLLGELIGEIQASDPEMDTLKYIIIEGNESQFFDLDIATGRLYYLGPAPMNHGEKYDLIVQVSDVELSKEINVSVSATDLIVLSNDKVLPVHELTIHPYSKELIISAFGFHSATMYTIDGKQVLTSSSNTINIDHLPKGVYIVHFQIESRRFSKRILKL